MPDHKRFVVLSMARSGTSLLLASLRQHPEIFCHGEIFHPKVHSHIREEYRAVADPTRRDSDPIGFVVDILAFTNGRSCVGFKMWRFQNETACDYVLARPDIAKIILERRNKLAHYSSGQLAKQSGIWNIGGLQPRARRKRPLKLDGIKADFHRDKFLHFLDHQAQLFNHYRKHVQGPRLEVTYDGLVTNGFADILSFLGVSAVTLQPMKHRIHGSDIVGRYQPEQRESIVQTLADIGQSDWANEDLGGIEGHQSLDAGSNVPKDDPDWLLFEQLFTEGAFARSSGPARRLLAGGAGDPRLKFAVAASLHRQGKWAKCLNQLDDCPVIDSLERRMLRMRAEAQIALNEIAAAEKTIDRFRGLVPEGNSALSDLTKRLESVKDTAQA